MHVVGKSKMKRRYKYTGTFLLLVAIALSGFALVLRHEAPCEPSPLLADDIETMKAVVYRCYGSPDVLKLEEIEKPTVADDEVLIRVRAASVNPYDWHFMRGAPYFMRLGSGIGTPNDARIGADFSGTVEAVGKSVERFKPGDDVFGGANGAFAEYVTIREDRSIVLKPAEISFEQAASVPIAGLTALQAVRDHGKVAPGKKLLINGASGGVGTFAVQLGKYFGADVTGVCSTRNVEMVRSLGADHVIDYKTEDVTDSEERFDVIIDNVSNHSPSKWRRLLKSDGTLVIVGGSKGNWIGIFMNPIKAYLLSKFVDQELFMFVAQFNRDDLTLLAELIASGKLTPVIDRRYPLGELPAAMRYSEEGHARGKIIINID